MRWSKQKHPIGTKKTVKKFAFLPRTMYDGVTVVWLRFYYQDLRYDEYGWPYVWIIVNERAE